MLDYQSGTINYDPAGCHYHDETRRKGYESAVLSSVHALSCLSGCTILFETKLEIMRIVESADWIVLEAGIEQKGGQGEKEDAKDEEIDEEQRLAARRTCAHCGLGVDVKKKVSNEE
uniref:Uncharacterized protein n=1 Tax=Pristionchus pacificus TaxID=54126 RepID=A0A2A6CY98_PRIPA|eukprot:PDM83011.1 hypothetical protein PRIPAC_37404 [Pristionchus pacificus]